MNMRTIGIGIVAVALILAISMTASADPQSPSSSNFTDEARYTPSSVNDTARGGNITNLELSGDVLTSKWQGYYGNVSGTITLRDAVGNYMINWSWSEVSGEVLATTNSSPNWSATLVAANNTSIDTAWHFNASDIDSAANTFTNATEEVTISGDTATTAQARTYNSTGTKAWNTTVVGGLNTTGYKDHYLFAGIIVADGNSYNNRTIDFQMIVPTEEDQDTYYFYMELS